MTWELCHLLTSSSFLPFKVQASLYFTPSENERISPENHMVGRWKYEFPFWNGPFFWGTFVNFFGGVGILSIRVGMIGRPFWLSDSRAKAPRFCWCQVEQEIDDWAIRSERSYNKIPSLKLTAQHLKIGLLKRKPSPSNHPLSGANC